MHWVATIASMQNGRECRRFIVVNFLPMFILLQSDHQQRSLLYWQGRSGRIAGRRRSKPTYRCNRHHRVCHLSILVYRYRPGSPANLPQPSNCPFTFIPPCTRLPPFLRCQTAVIEDRSCSNCNATSRSIDTSKYGLAVQAPIPGPPTSSQQTFSSTRNTHFHPLSPSALLMPPRQ